MKRVILAVLFVLIAAAVIAGALVFINKLVNVPESEILNSELIFEAKDVSGITVDISAGYVDVYTLSGDSIVVSFAEPKSGTYRASAENGTLTVKETTSSIFDALSRGDSGRYGVRIGIPEGLSVSCNVNAGIGDVSIEGITAPAVSIDIDTGSLFIVALHTDDLKVNVDIGDVIASLPEVRDDYFVSVNTEIGGTSAVSGGDENAPHRVDINVNIGDVTLSYKG